MAWELSNERQRDHGSIKLQAVEVEFSEEAVTDYQHRDKQKEINVLEWIAKVILEPLQVSEDKNLKYNYDKIH